MSQLKGSRAGGVLPYLGEDQPFVPIQGNNNRFDEAHPHYEGHSVLFILPILTHPKHRNAQNNVWPNIWAPHGPVKLTYKVNSHTKLN